MGQEFERKIVHAWNDYFEENNIKGYAYRRKQSRFQSQVVDVLVDSPEIGYIAIECKSKKSKYGKRLNFKSAFPSTDEGHQIERTTRFAEATGRDPVLAVEYKHGRGKSREGQMYRWKEVQKLFNKEGEKSIGPKHLKEYKYNIKREGTDYQIVDLQ